MRACQAALTRADLDLDQGWDWGPEIIGNNPCVKCPDAECSS